jgi:pantetheine-phosphate adenylyltransferase
MLALLDEDKFVNGEDKETLKIAILFHDAVYDPKSQTNEEDSYNLFKKWVLIRDINLGPAREEKIRSLIMATKTHQHFSKGIGDLENVIIDLDLHILHENFLELLEWEDGIFKEYQFCSITDYITGRMTFLRSILETMDDSPNNVESLIKYVSTKTYKIGIYPGSFNPFHKGHLDILHQAEKIFDKVIIARGINAEKGPTLYELPKSLPNEKIVYTTLVSELFKKPNGINVEFTMIRGLRNEYDMAAEENLRKWVQESDPTIRFIYFISDSSLEHVSSSTIKGLLRFDPELAKKYIVE